MYEKQLGVIYWFICAHENTFQLFFYRTDGVDLMFSFINYFYQWKCGKIFFSVFFTIIISVHTKLMLKTKKAVILNESMYRRFNQGNFR